MSRRTRVAAEDRVHKAHEADRVPVVLPLLSITIGDAGTATEAGGGRLDVTLNGEPHPVPAGAGEGRSALGPLIEQVTTDLGCPVRIEVREVDGSVFTEIVKPPPPQTPGPAPVLVAAEPPSAAWTSVEPSAVEYGRLEVGGSGFAPDEQVAVAVVVAHQTAGPDGCARLRLPAALLASRPGTVVLLGRASGFVAVSGSRA
ncbi:hypothetical protein [Nocardioides sp. GXZ039]|uniref:hypothetical protein n=1 Tax=Nocardioides sp. GXZ039 TaxID=3136018 RepID=UPI0030F3ABBF